MKFNLNLFVLLLAGGIVVPFVRGTEQYQIRSEQWPKYCITFDDWNVRLYSECNGNSNKLFNKLSAVYSNGYANIKTLYGGKNYCLEATGSGNGDLFTLPGRQNCNPNLDKQLFKLTSEGKIQLNADSKMCIGRDDTTLKVMLCNPPGKPSDWIPYDRLWKQLNIADPSPLLVQLQNQRGTVTQCLTWDDYKSTMYNDCTRDNKQWRLILNPYGGQSVIFQMNHETTNRAKCLQANSAVVGSGFKLDGVDCNGNDPLQKFRWTTENKIKLIDYPDKDLCIGNPATGNNERVPIEVMKCTPAAGQTDQKILWIDSSGNYVPQEEPSDNPTAAPVVQEEVLEPLYEPERTFASDDDEFDYIVNYLENYEYPCPEGSIDITLSCMDPGQPESCLDTAGTCDHVRVRIRDFDKPDDEKLYGAEFANEFNYNIYRLIKLYREKGSIGESCEKLTETIHEDIHEQINANQTVPLTQAAPLAWTFNDPDNENIVIEFLDYSIDWDYNKMYEEGCNELIGHYEVYNFNAVCEEMKYEGTTKTVLKTVNVTVSGLPECLSQTCSGANDEELLFDKYALHATEERNDKKFEATNSKSSGFYWKCQGKRFGENNPGAHEAACLLESISLGFHLGLKTAVGNIKPQVDFKKFLYLLATDEEIVSFNEKDKVVKYQSECEKAKGVFQVLDTWITCSPSSGDEEANVFEVTQMPVCQGQICGETATDAVVGEIFKKMMGSELVPDGMVCEASGAYANSYVVVAMIGTIGAMGVNLL